MRDPAHGQEGMGQTVKRRILLIGSARTELSLHTDAFAADGETRFGAFAGNTVPGGPLSYAGVAITRLGGEAILCSAVGDDPYGRDLVRFYEELGMDTRFIKTVRGEASPLGVTAERADGARRSYRSSVLSETIDCDLVEDAFTTLPDAVWLSLEIPVAAAARAAALAREKQIPLFADGEHIPADFPLEALGDVTLIALGTDAAARYTGIEPRSAQSNLEAAVELAKILHAGTYMFRAGVGGAFAFKGNFSYYIPYVEGADTRLNELFVPSMILEYLRSAKTVRAARYASTVIARAAARGGEPIAAVPTETEVLKYILEHEVEL